MNLPKVLLIIPPLTQLNTPYPSTAYLTGFLQAQGIACEQRDLGLDMVLRLFSREGLQAVFGELDKRRIELPFEAGVMMKARDRYIANIDQAVTFLQKPDPDSGATLLKRGVLPHGPRFRSQRDLSRSAPLIDRAMRWATLFIEDLTDLIQATVAPHFGLSRYAEHLARSASSFDSLLSALGETPALTDVFMLESLWAYIDRVRPTLIGLSVPFPGNVYGAFRVAQAIKQRCPDIPIVLGGGYVNTELRRISDPRIFNYIDYVTLDGGERPLLSLIEYLSGRRTRDMLCRTFYRSRGKVRFVNDPASLNFALGDTGTPTYRGLTLDRYMSILDSTNPMHRLWSEGHWNKLTVAHGCYWKQCTFCDVGLDYIGRYEPAPTEALINQVQTLIAETGHRGFHFVDEAAPPAALKAMAIGLLERRIKVRWWGNIRFEQTFSPDLCRLLAAAGCIAVTAGLEAASDRLLEKMKKGISVDQTALVASAFREAGVMVHAYLMYGFPSETLQETVDSLERVRQLFSAGVMQSAFWHRFTATAHSPIGLDAKSHGLRIVGPDFKGFAENDLTHEDLTSHCPPWVGEGLRRSMLNFLERRGLSMDVRSWFDHAVPRPRVSSRWTQTILRHRRIIDDVTAERRIVWIGGANLHAAKIIAGAKLSAPHREWIKELIDCSTPRRGKKSRYPRLQDVGSSFPGTQREFQAFAGRSLWRRLRSEGLLLV
ncbi:radical SAM protein [Nitrospira sp. KM1]|uniref:B12-binding domain-containing radical SAM protein n=1 Tax=Nitrospira sp. KM1 TaxID=1936990 RepID=UPI001565A627|nr:radical SAM protein [Nitrospira sp. KM1]